MSNGLRFIYCLWNHLWNHFWSWKSITEILIFNQSQPGDNNFLPRGSRWVVITLESRLQELGRGTRFMNKSIWERKKSLRILFENHYKYIQIITMDFQIQCPSITWGKENKVTWKFWLWLLITIDFWSTVDQVRL